jgi:hypothetical protein
VTMRDEGVQRPESGRHQERDIDERRCHGGKA